jgi:AP-1 complex subunit beta-1
VVLAEKPVIADDTTQMDPSLLDLLINNISTLVSIYHKPAETFVRKVRNPLGVAHDDDDDDDDDESDDDDDESGDDGSAGAAAGSSSGGGGGAEVDMLGLGDMGVSSSSSSSADTGAGAGTSSAPSGDLLGDFFGGGNDSGSSSSINNGSGGSNGGAAAVVLLPELVGSDAGAGMVLRGKLVRQNARISLDLQFDNQTSATELSQFAVQFNKNTFALAPVEQKVQLTPAVQQGQSQRFSVPVAIKPAFASKGEKPSLIIQVAMKDMVSSKVHFFQVSE